MSDKPSFPGPNDAAIFARPMPRGVRTGNGLKWTGGTGGECLSLFDPKERYEQQVPQQVKAATTTSHPFKVSKDTTANHFKVKAGTCEGQTITAQTIDVGSTRPVAILVYPQYTLGIDSGEFVNSIAVKTGLNKPVLVSSTSILSDVDSGITSAGTEARALIAYIDVGDVISQITTGNIVGRFGDDGSRTGKASGYYDKNS